LKFAAVVAAAGTGTRLPLSNDVKAKQFYNLGGLPIYLWSLSRLALHKQIEKIALVLAPDFRSLVEQDLASLPPELFGDKVFLIDGGATRQDSVRKSLEALENFNPEYVLVHDAARPFLTDEMIDQSIAQVTEYGACSLAVPVSDTVKKGSADIFGETIDRTGLFLIQTPQSALFRWLLDAHREASGKNLSTTDDAGILQAAGHQVYIVQGSAHNLKLTKPDDLALCQALATIYSPALKHV
jgi:2-C-methyl-D-erythritol 4-phosphate cytidylyltransferase